MLLMLLTPILLFPTSTQNIVPDTNVTISIYVPTAFPATNVTLPTSIPTTIPATDSTVLIDTNSIVKCLIESLSFCNEIIDLVVDGSSFNEEKDRAMKLDAIVNECKNKN